MAVWIAGCAPTEPTSTPAAHQQATAPSLPQASPQTTETGGTPAGGHESKRERMLIHQVDQAYARGEAAYRKGRLAEAKTEFDRAVDLLLLSGIDIKQTPVLEEELNRILDQVNGLEMEALKRGNGFTTPEEETPGEAAAEVTFKVDPNFVARAQADLATTKSDLPLVVNDYVAAFINFFANTKRGHNTLLHSFQRSGRYRAMIQRVMAEEGVPQDLIYLAVAESGFNPRAMNPGSHAGGMWQFMPYGNYGLARNAYVDERFDPEKSTRAYARYMKFIYDQLGDWYLSMAGYDWGTGNVQRAVQKTGYADFWELYRRNNLPGETKNYVPEILAAIIIANHPTQYGFDDITLDPPVMTDTVTINYSIDLRLVSDLVGAPISELEALNPSLLRRMTPPDASFDLHLPAGTATLYEQRVATIPEAHRNGWRYHRVVAGETLATVAHDYHLSAADLASANQLSADADLKTVEALAIPQAAAPAPVARASSASSSSSAAASSATTSYSRAYTTRKGDTLVTIADRFGVSLSQLRHWNHLSGSSVKMKPGRKLHVSEPTTAAPRGKHGRHEAASSDRTEETQTHSTKKGRRHEASSTDADTSEARSTKKGRRHRAEASSDTETSSTKSSRKSEGKARSKHGKKEKDAEPSEKRGAKAPEAGERRGAKSAEPSEKRGARSRSESTESKSGKQEERKSAGKRKGSRHK